MATLDRDFDEACGLQAPLRLTGARADRPGIARTLDRPFALIGRDPGADLVLDHPTVGRRHAYLQVISGRVVCIDLESRTGVRWKDEPRVMGWVDDGESLLIGPFQIRPQLTSAEADCESVPMRPGVAGEVPLPTSRSFAPTGLAEATLEFLDPSAEQTIWQISRALVLVGRSRLCRVRLIGSDVSGIHCSLVRTPKGIWVVDLLGLGGTLVNGRPVRSARLGDGDELQVGVKRFRLHHGITPDLPARRTRAAGAPLIPEVGLAPAGRRGVDDATLAPLLREFGLMQQQMADQFQQALLSMFRLFSGMHEDQMSLIREELGRLHQLTEEQRVLQARLNDPLPESPGSRPDLRVVTSETPVALTFGGAQTVGEDAGPPCADPDQVACHVTRIAASGESETAGGPMTGADLHGQIIQRLAIIQEERQGRWQKLLGSMLGRGDSGAVADY